MATVISKRFQVRNEDLLKVGKNALIFLAPLAIIYFSAVVIEIQKEGIEWADFQPSNIVIGAMVLYVINVLLDFFRKFMAESKYTK